MPKRGADDLSAAEARIAELEALEAERAHAIAVQAALYRIAEAASAADDLQAFYRTIHEIVGELMYAENLYIALYDDERGRMNYPYYVDASTSTCPDPNAWEPFGVGQATGITAYALRRGEPILIDGAEYQRLASRGRVRAARRHQRREHVARRPAARRRTAARAPRRAVVLGRAHATPTRTSTCSRSSASTSPRR